MSNQRVVIMLTSMDGTKSETFTLDNINNTLKVGRGKKPSIFAVKTLSREHGLFTLKDNELLYTELKNRHGTSMVINDHTVTLSPDETRQLGKIDSHTFKKLCPMHFASKFSDVNSLKVNVSAKIDDTSATKSTQKPSAQPTSTFEDTADETFLQTESIKVSGDSNDEAVIPVEIDTGKSDEPQAEKETAAESTQATKTEPLLKDSTKTENTETSTAETKETEQTSNDSTLSSKKRKRDDEIEQETDSKKSKGDETVTSEKEEKSSTEATSEEKKEVAATPATQNEERPSKRARIFDYIFKLGVGAAIGSVSTFALLVATAPQ